MNRDEIIKYCLELPNVYEDYPFPKDNISVTMKHKNNNKWFALIMRIKGEEYLNIKTNPEYSELLRKAYDYIIPAYHMNKEHWNTIILSDKCDKKLVEELLVLSYELTKK
ncbi:MAG: MmcQ/YjbR family DNA-binding protein [Clostridia bacterium]|nr:MmcQ/YjbR family DNA-binding protein [Clostridia bacterium]